MKKACLLLIVILLMPSLEIHADPADPAIRKTIRTSDGRQREVRLVGDEYGHYWLSADDGQCFIEKVGSTDIFVPVDPAVINQRAHRLRQAEFANSSTRRQLPHASIDLTGEKRILVILVEFSDIKFKAEHKIEWFDAILDQPNYVVPSAHQGSVYDYFLAQSGGKFHLRSDIVGPVTVSHNSAYYGADSDQGLDANAMEMVTEAIDLVKHKVNFSRYDWTGKGTVETVLVIYAGKPQSGGGTADDIWPHKHTINLKHDNTVIKSYACASELRRYGSVFKINSIGSFCHELSHCLGLPDTYDPAGVNYGTVIWDVMGTGCHNNYGYTPAGYTAYDKMFCQWQAPIVLSNDTIVKAMKPMSEGGDFYLIANDAHEEEFYLLENRQKVGWDEKLSGHGMLITHVDYDPNIFAHNKVNQCGVYGNDHERISLVLADNNTKVTSGNSIEKAKDYQGDLFPYGSNDMLTNSSTPAATLFRNNIDDTYLLSKPVTDIHENSDKTMGFTFRNDIAKAGIVYLSHDNDSVKVTSDTSAQLTADIKNHGYGTYSNQVRVDLCECQDGLHTNRKNIHGQRVDIAPNNTEKLTFDINGLNSTTDYHLLFYYQSNNGWTPMQAPVDLDMNSIYDIRPATEGNVLNISDNSIRLNIRLYNQSYKTYDHPVSAIVYSITDDGFEELNEKTFVTNSIPPNEEVPFSFLIEGLNSYEDYFVLLQYSPDRNGETWKPLNDGYQVYIDNENIIYPGDVNRDGSINVADAMMTVDNILGIKSEAFHNDSADVNFDCIIDISDIMRIVDIILKKQR